MIRILHFFLAAASTQCDLVIGLVVVADGDGAVAFGTREVERSVGVNSIVGVDRAFQGHYVAPHIWQRPLLHLDAEFLRVGFNHLTEGEEDYAEANSSSAQATRIPQKRAATSFGLACAYATSATLILNLPDVLWLIACIQLIRFSRCTLMYISAMVFTLVIAESIRKQVVAEEEKYPSMASYIDWFAQLLGPTLLLLSTAYLFHAWWVHVNKAPGNASSCKGEEEKGTTLSEASNLSGVKFEHFVVVTLAASSDNFALDMWLFFGIGLDFLPILVGCVVGCFLTVVVALIVNRMPAIVNALSKIPLFAIVGFLTAIAFAGLVFE